MICSNNDKFVINKSLANEFILTIKQQDSTLPMTITSTDTFKANLYKLSDNTKVMSSEGTSPLITIIPYGTAVNGEWPSGKIALTISDASSLDVSRGSKADRYYLKPVYRLSLECDTTNNGTFVAKVNKVYVDM